MVNYYVYYHSLRSIYLTSVCEVQKQVLVSMKVLVRYFQRGWVFRESTLLIHHHLDSLIKVTL